MTQKYAFCNIPEMEKENITPEEKLLKIIESGQAEKRKPPGVLNKTQGKKKNLAVWFQSIRINKDTLKFFNLQSVNRIIIAVCILITVFFIFDFFRFNIQLKNRFAYAISGMAGVAPENEKPIFPELNTADILNQVKARNIFTFFPEKIQQTQQAVDSEMISNLKLVGIIWSDKPQTMIENTKEQKTYLLSTGENIGEVKIKKILRDKVVLSLEDKEWELR